MIRKKAKEYVVVMNGQKNLLGGSKFVFNSVEEMSEQEINEYIKKHGKSGIEYIFRNNPIEVEIIVNMKEGN